MSLRHGVTAQEENKLKHLISQGKTWEDIVRLCNPEEEGAPKLLADVNLDVVKRTIFDPLSKKLEAAKKAGHKTIHALEAAEAAKRAEKKALAKDIGE